MESTIEFCIFELVFVSNFYFEQIVLKFWIKFAQQGYLWLKTEKSKYPGPLVQSRKFRAALDIGQKGDCLFE